ncbi:MAG: ATP-dependent zinc metalloprotease FtsH [Puniceicoccales bacterium]|jgi:cell division protease FtsH|nr:ATP-dependent zinc metalloprotease FtsH [Puniceicoccales bacterium]
MGRGKKPRPLGSFRPKIFAIWGALIFLLLSAWVLVSPAAPRVAIEWTMGDVADAAAAGRIISGELRSVPNRGLQWYKVSGKAQLAPPPAPPVDFFAQGRLTDARFHQIVSCRNLRERPGSTFLSDLALSILPFLFVLFLLFVLFGRRVQGAGRSAMTFGKTRARLYAGGEKKITFQDVAGCDEAKEEVAEIVDFLKQPQKYSAIGGKIPKGCLMVGPPGTGKTLLAKAVAGEADVPFFSVSGSDFVEMFVGVGAARVRDLFEQGRKNAPCIVFIDEIDAVGRQRGAGLGGGNDEREQTLNSILVEMDGFDGRDGVIIMAATTRPDVLDSALLRPGRFDRQVLIDLPDIRGREEILQVHAKKIKMSKHVDLKKIARNTPGFAGADLENLLNEGALMAARKGKKIVERSDLEEARDKVAYGRERRKLMDEEDRRITAYHEAGHAIVQAHIDDGLLPVHRVTILPRGRSLGSTMFLPTKDILNQSQHHARNQICCAMGGRIAEEIFLGETSSGAAGDIKSATELARHMICDWGMGKMGPVALGENVDHIFLGRDITRTQNYSENTACAIDGEIVALIADECERARKILEEKRTAVEALVQLLLEKETVEGEEIYGLLADPSDGQKEKRSRPKRDGGQSREE